MGIMGCCTWLCPSLSRLSVLLVRMADWKAAFFEPVVVEVGSDFSGGPVLRRCALTYVDSAGPVCDYRGVFVKRRVFMRCIIKICKIIIILYFHFYLIFNAIVQKVFIFGFNYETVFAHITHY